MMRYTTPPERNSATPTIRRPASRAAFIFSLLGALGIVAAVGITLLVFSHLTIDLGEAFAAIQGVFLCFVTALAMGIIGLGEALPWRRAGGQSRLNDLSITLAMIALVGAGIGVLLVALSVLGLWKMLVRI